MIFDPDASDASFASAGDPTAPPTEEAPVEEAPVEETPATDAPAASAPTAEALPSDVTGQTAAETRCSAGRTPRRPVARTARIVTSGTCGL